MDKNVTIIGAGLAGSEAALQLADRGVHVRLCEARPLCKSSVHKTDTCAELVCSNSLKSTKPNSAAGLLKEELARLHSRLYACALACKVDAGGALAVDRNRFSAAVHKRVLEHPNIHFERNAVTSIAELAAASDACIVASGPLTTDALVSDLCAYTGSETLAFYDAAAPIVETSSLRFDRLFLQDRYEDAVPVHETGASPDTLTCDAPGVAFDDGRDVAPGAANDAAYVPAGNAEHDAIPTAPLDAATSTAPAAYLNAPLSQEEYEHFIHELAHAKRVILRDFETKDLFQACQPIEEIARKGLDAPRFGALKPVGLRDPRTGKRPYAVVQLRAENAEKTAYNLVGFQTNLTFPEQKRVFQLIPALSEAEFSRYGVMHRNTFLCAPRLLNANLQLTSLTQTLPCPVYVAGQLSGSEGYSEAIRSGLHVALAVAAQLSGVRAPIIPDETVFGSLLHYMTHAEPQHFQPMHVNFGIMKPLDVPCKNKTQRYTAYAQRASRALENYASELENLGLLKAEYGK